MTQRQVVRCLLHCEAVCLSETLVLVLRLSLSRLGS